MRPCTFWTPMLATAMALETSGARCGSQLGGFMSEGSNFKSPAVILILVSRHAWSHKNSHLWNPLPSVTTAGRMLTQSASEVRTTFSDNNTTTMCHALTLKIRFEGSPDGTHLRRRRYGQRLPRSCWRPRRVMIRIKGSKDRPGCSR